MRTKRRTSAVRATLVALVLVASADAQSRSDREKMHAQQQVVAAEAALSAAVNDGAATLAPALYHEALTRLEYARQNWNASKSDVRRMATLRAVEAVHAARAAEAQAELVTLNNDIRALRTSMASASGSARAVTLYDPPATISRGTTSMDHVITAQNALRSARAAGGESVAPTLLENAEQTLETARRLAENDKQSETADHLAYVAEMTARRAELNARANAAQPIAVTLREEQALLPTTPPARPATVVITGVDREARMAAERDLRMLQERYEAELREGRMSRAEIDALRRQVDEQSAALRALQERERATESARLNEIETLENALLRERSDGRLTAEALAEREAELRRQRNELEQLRLARQESERTLAQMEQARMAALAEAERLREQAAQQANELRDQVEVERARTAETEARLLAAREELARREALNQQRIAAMQQALAALAKTRTTERGFIVTLPGLFFDSGRSALKAGARNTLTKIADQLRISPDLRIAIEGHTDSVGGEQMNQALSERRAAAVRDYLVSRGFPADRMTMTGLGETAPVANNDTAAGRQQNRRVELIITQQID